MTSVTGTVLKFRTKGRWSRYGHTSTQSTSTGRDSHSYYFGQRSLRPWAEIRPDFTYRTNATEVRLNFSATDQNNHGVATLQASDFAVVDKDVIVRNFQSFTRSDWTKLEIAILVDTSQSVSPRFRQEMAEVLELVSQTAEFPRRTSSCSRLRTRNRLSFAPGTAARLARPRSTSRRTRAGGLTPLFDTIIFAANFLAKQGDPHAEKVLIVFSDGARHGQPKLAGQCHRRFAARRSSAGLHRLEQSCRLSQGAAVLQTLASAHRWTLLSISSGGAIRH